MIQLKRGNILDADVEAIVNTVNCVGVMGAGLALQIRKAFPSNYLAYVEACKNNKVKPGKMFTWRVNQETKPKYIINFPTKRHWRNKSRVDDIEAGLAALAKEIKRKKIKSIAVPPLGCGLGGLDFKDILPRIIRGLHDVGDVEIHVYEPA